MLNCQTKMCVSAGWHQRFAFKLPARQTPRTCSCTHSARLRLNPEVAWRSWKRGRLRRTRVKSLRPEIAVRFPLSTFRMARCNDAIPERRLRRIRPIPHHGWTPHPDMNQQPLAGRDGVLPILSTARLHTSFGLSGHCRCIAPEIISPLG